MDTIAEHQSGKKNKPQRNEGLSTSVSDANAEDDYVHLLLLKERRIESLESEVAALTIHSDSLQRRCDAQLEIIGALKVGRGSASPQLAGKRRSGKNSTAPNVVQMLGSSTEDRPVKQVIQLTDLPEFFDQSEFQPIDDTPPVSVAGQVVGQTRHWLLNGIKKVLF